VNLLTPAAERRLRHVGSEADRYTMSARTDPNVCPQVAPLRLVPSTLTATTPTAGGYPRSPFWPQAPAV
jgi:hypothetical protein